MKYNQPWGISDPNAGYINGNPAIGLQGSIPTAESIEYDQREIVEVISAANTRGYRDFDGVACALSTNTDLTQLRKAVEGYARYWVEVFTANQGVPEAPTDGRMYGRINQAWGLVPPEAPADNNYYVRYNNTWVLTPAGAGFPEAPVDTQIYGRQNAGWTLVPTGGAGGGLADAPNDGLQYARQQLQWSVVRPYDNVFTVGNCTGGPSQYIFTAGNPHAPVATGAGVMAAGASPAAGVSPMTTVPAFVWGDYVESLTIVMVPPMTNNGPATINVNNLGAVNIYRSDGQQLQPGDLAVGGNILIYNSTGGVVGFRVSNLVRSQILEISPYP